MASHGDPARRVRRRAPHSQRRRETAARARTLLASGTLRCWRAYEPHFYLGKSFEDFCLLKVQRKRSATFEPLRREPALGTSGTTVCARSSNSVDAGRMHSKLWEQTLVVFGAYLPRSSRNAVCSLSPCGISETVIMKLAVGVPGAPSGDTYRQSKRYG